VEVSLLVTHAPNIAISSRLEVPTVFGNRSQDRILP
jgi:hypothetical protein